MAGLTIGKLAAAEGVGVETVRFYQRRGLLGLPERQSSSFREYSEADRWRLAFGPIETRCTDDIVRAAQAKLGAIDEQVRDLRLLQCRLRRLVQVCEHGNGDDCLALHLGEPL